MKCEKCGTEFKEGIFCPNCGTKYNNNIDYMKNNENNNSSNPKEKLYQRTWFIWLMLIFIFPMGLYLMWKYKKRWKTFVKIIITVIVLFFAWCMLLPTENEDKNNSNQSNKTESKEKELETKLSDTVTEDYLPGTYVADNGQIFGIDVSDTDIFNLNAKLADAFGGCTFSGCSVIFPDNTWLEEYGIIDVADKTISISKNLVYKYKIKKDKLTLTTPNNEKIVLKKVSDEYNPNELYDTSDVGVDDIIGNYYCGDSSNSFIQVNKKDDKTVNVYYIDLRELEPSYRVVAWAEDVPVSEFYKNKYVALMGNSYGNVYACQFSDRFKLGIVGDYNAYLKNEVDTDIDELLDYSKKIYTDVPYKYSEFADKIVVLTSDDGKEDIVFNKSWYDKYSSFTGDADLDVKSDSDGKCDVYINNIKNCSFKDSDCEYIVGTSTCIKYNCDNGTSLYYYPNLNEDNPYSVPSPAISINNQQYTYNYGESSSADEENSFDVQIFRRQTGPLCTLEISKNDYQETYISLYIGKNDSQSYRRLENIYVNWIGDNNDIGNYFNTETYYGLDLRQESYGYSITEFGDVNNELSFAGTYVSVDSSDDLKTSDEIFPNDAVNLLDEATVADYAGQNDFYELAINEIYARHGRKFNDKKLQNYFETCSWYNGIIEPDEFDESVLSSVEKQNLQLLARYREE